ncbi:MAG: FAD-dependent oxidoreductase [Acidobacteria bacterium]|nr:FAD-dependent oxidoreductase [Acidobacteriota bacterium]MBI3663979.1 FAD-dependent oxidoreductase [Acidobacteriota bacterium]
MKVVFVVGAGPAGLYASQKIARAGYSVIILNRDIKPGGLAEYGIYPAKEKMKGGLRKQFAKILELPQVSYFGHLPVGQGYALHLDELRELDPAALVFAVGAQGTKKLGLPGEEARGVYSAKNFVYHYNRLPPFSTQDYSTGKRVAIVGMGNVAVDIARWLLEDDPEHKAEEVTIVARRGPFEAKFDEKEFAHVEQHLDRRSFQDELERVKDRIAAVGEDIAKVPETTFPILARPYTEPVKPRLRFRFLCSPKEIVPSADGRIAKLVVTENLLVARDGGTAAKATDQTDTLDFDTMIFAIGDTADPNVGLPFAKDSYVTNPDTTTGEHAAYEVFDSATGKVMTGTFVVGWARKASEGLVGVARFDAEKGATHILQYLEGAADRQTATPTEIAKRIERGGRQLVDKAGLECLGRAEAAQAQALGLPSFKFAEDAKMLAAIAEEKRANTPVPADD